MTLTIIHIGINSTDLDHNLTSEVVFWYFDEEFNMAKIITE